MHNFNKTRLLVGSLSAAICFTVSGVELSPPAVFQPSAVTSYRYADIYTLPGGEQRASVLNPEGVQLLMRGGTETFIETLEREFPHWAFTPAQEDLTGSFIIQNYYACGLATENCGSERSVEGAHVGAFIDVTYQPGPGDPAPGNSELHWIQRVFSNHDVVAGFGVNSDRIDNENDVIDPVLGPCDESPYYDCAFLAGEDYFVDRPQRTVAQENDIVWGAELYLVEQTGNRQVTIYEGMKWGWITTNLGLRSLVAPPSDISFDNPLPPPVGDVVVNGIGSHAISWGLPLGGKSPSTLIIDREVNELRPLIGQPFRLGTVTYSNATIQGGTGINSAELTIDTVIDVWGTDISDLEVSDMRLVSMINTANTCNARTPGDCTPEQERESADYVSIPPAADLNAVSDTFPAFAELGNNFHVMEEDSATATLIGRITQVKINAADSINDGLLPLGPNAPPPDQLAEEPQLVWEILGFGEVIQGRGFITIGEAGVSVDDDAIPADVNIRIPDGGKVSIAFDSGKPSIGRREITALEELIVILRKHPQLHIDIGGHTDDAEAPRLKQQLSLDRAEAVSRFLIRNGISNRRISTTGYGQDKPIVSNETQAGRARNRRAELLVFDPDRRR